MHEGHRQRKRDSALNGGFENLETHEVLELLLYFSIPRNDTNPTAHNLIERFGGFDRVFDAEFSELCEVEGIGERSAFLLKLIPEVFRRYEMSKTKKRINVGMWDELIAYVKSLFVGARVEKFFCICLSAGRNVVSTRLMHSGFADHIDLPFQEIIKEAISRSVRYVVIAHNHPFGTAVFSNDDIHYTEKLREALAVMDIEFIDHFVVCGDECTSYLEWSRNVN